MKHSDTRDEETGTLICSNTQLWSLLCRSTNIYACAHTCCADTCTQSMHSTHMCKHTHTCPLLSTLLRCWFMSQTRHQGYTQQSDWKKNEWQSDSEMAIDSWNVQEGREKSKLHERHPTPPHPRLDEQNVTTIHDVQLFLSEVLQLKTIC